MTALIPFAFTLVTTLIAAQTALEHRSQETSCVNLPQNSVD